MSLLDDPNRNVRNAATRSLGKQRAVEGVAPIVLALSEGRVARAVGGQALIDIGPVAVDSLAGLMHAQSPDVRAVAAELLGAALRRERDRRAIEEREARLRSIMRSAVECVRPILRSYSAWVQR